MNILVISVHPDDETLGCGGTLLKYKETGNKISCLYVTDGNSMQREVIPEISDSYGFDQSIQLGLPELELDDISLNIIIPKIADVINSLKPEQILIPNRSDVHSDHRKVFQALTAATKSFRYPFIKKIWMCEVISETDFAPMLPENVFMPNVFVDISDFFEKKIQILSKFKSELMSPPYTRSIDTVRAHSRYRGSQINVNYAEAFMLLKEII